MQGDVTALINMSGTVVAKYVYDAWGKIISVTDGNGAAITDKTDVAHLNPFRYRGYMCDEETGFYYLRSRYYDPEVGRFLNADNIVSMNQGLDGNNLYAYCGNNPVCNVDIGGHQWEIVTLLEAKLHVVNTFAVMCGFYGINDEGMHLICVFIPY